MIFSTQSRAVAHANEVGNPVFRISYMDGIGETVEYWVEDVDAEKGVFVRTLTNFASAHVDAGTFNSLERL